MKVRSMMVKRWNRGHALFDEMACKAGGSVDKWATLSALYGPGLTHFELMKRFIRQHGRE